MTKPLPVAVTVSICNHLSAIESQFHSRCHRTLRCHTLLYLKGIARSFVDGLGRQVFPVFVPFSPPVYPHRAYSGCCLLLESSLVRIVTSNRWFVPLSRCGVSKMFRGAGQPVMDNLVTAHTIAISSDLHH
ncbi:hypothetical protein J6590_019560 [Homalodisca vitripennis]|nr:hypothetical protein J6590_019560 [Homalodisca vitripennis]